MDKLFYQNCIMEYRNARCFLNFENEEWYKEITDLSKREEFKKIIFIPKSIEFADNDLKFPFLTYSFKRLFSNFENIRNNVGKYPFSKQILDIFISINEYILLAILYSYKPFKFGNIEEVRRENFSKVNLPIIGMMDYFLEKAAFRHLACIMERLEYEYIDLWFELTYEKMGESIKKNIHNPDILYFFSKIRTEELIKFLKNENISIINIMKNATGVVVYVFLKNVICPNEYICNEIFLKAFANYNLEEQVYIADLMEEMEYNVEFILNLHELFNKKITCKNEREFLYSSFQMKEKRVKSLIETIEESSYFTKSNIGASNVWNDIMLGWKNVTKEFNPNIKVSDYYLELINLYWKCREYATSSIVNSLYPLNSMQEKTTHIKDEKFNILVRTRTMWEKENLKDTFEIRAFCSFSILTEKNMSHYGNHVLYGYYTNVSEYLIAHIYPTDSLSYASAKYEFQLTDRINMLLDIEDLNEKTLQKRTYNQLCIRTKNKSGEILWSDCIICISEVDERSKKMADKLSLKIVVLHKNKDTIEENDDIYQNLN